MRVRLAAAEQLREVALCGALATAMSSFVVLGLPRGGDLAAHLYRTDLVQHGILIWDNLWFAGQYPLTSYSLLYYLLAAVVGNTVLGIAGVAIAAGIFASVAQEEWKRVGRWPARIFAILLAGQAFTAAYPYDLGLAMLIATLWALQRRRVWLAVCTTLLTLGFSPLALLFLALALVALFLRRRQVNRQAILVGGAVAVAGGSQLALLVVLPTPGIVYPYGWWRLALGLAVSGIGLALCLRGRGGWRLGSIFVIWAAASVVAAVVPSPVGHNLIRADVFVVPLMLVAAALADFRPRRLAIVAIAASLAANVGPYFAMIPARSSSIDSTATFWRPLIAFLHKHSTEGFRVEVVPTANHWEAYYLPRAGFALARGWYRQLDIADDAALYAPTLTPGDYRQWLRQHAVRFVVVPRLEFEAIDGNREADLLESGRAGLKRVLRIPQGTIYELPRPLSLLTGPAPARVTSLVSSRISGYVARPGAYFLRVRFSPYWSVTRGDVCLAPGRSGMTELRARRSGPFSIQAAEGPGGVIADLFDADSAPC